MNLLQRALILSYADQIFKNNASKSVEGVAVKESKR
jgi:hypothetical protein